MGASLSVGDLWTISSHADELVNVDIGGLDHEKDGTGTTWKLVGGDWI